jgi:GTPase involved in cell partitioning and DNA repair
MDKNLSVEQFSDILVNSYHNYVHNLQAKAFISCVNKFDKPFLHKEEEECLRKYTRRYLTTIQQSVLYFSRRIVDFE